MGLKSSPLQLHSTNQGCVPEEATSVKKFWFWRKARVICVVMGVGSGVVLGRGQDVAIPALRATCHLEEIVQVVEMKL